MKKPGLLARAWWSIVMMLIILLSLTAATYAWFSSNRVVDTDRVQTRYGTTSLELQVSSQGGNAFRGSQEAAMVQVNATSLTSLLPVSTADLKTFVYNPITVNDMASGFVPVENENRYYHGRVYLRAAAEGQPQGSTMALYLDESEAAGGKLATVPSGQLLHAARLGLTFGEQKTDAVIFFLSEKANNGSGQVRNTSLNGVVLEDGQVLDGSSGTVRAAKDPSVALETYTIVMNGENTVLPDKPLIYMELNKIYPVDIYFYLEGCDPDCSDVISYDSVDLHLAFYGVLTGTEGGGDQ